jgi:hypothetical protein
MKLDENFFITLIYRLIAMLLEANHYGTVCYKGMTIYLTRQVSPSGLSGSAPALRYSAFAVNDYGFRLKCLAPVQIRFVKYPG